MNSSRNLMKTFGRQCGPVRRIVFAFASIFAPGLLVVSILKGLLATVDDLNEEELRELIIGMQDD
jgi:hypothetical protein